MLKKKKVPLQSPKVSFFALTKISLDGMENLIKTLFPHNSYQVLVAY